MMSIRHKPHHNLLLVFSYNINFDNIKGKECYIITDSKGIIRNLIPLNGEKKKENAPDTVQNNDIVGPDKLPQPIEPGMDGVNEGGPSGEELFT